VAFDLQPVLLGVPDNVHLFGVIGRKIGLTPLYYDIMKLVGFQKSDIFFGGNTGINNDRSILGQVGPQDNQ